MLRSNLPRAVRHLRRRRGWRQADLADAAGISRQVVSRIECGQLGAARMRTIGRVLDALDAAGELVVRWQGEQLDRLMDADHAALVTSTVELLNAAGWLTRVEVSFNHFGERGRVDILGFEPRTRTLVVIEVKTAIGDTQQTIGTLDTKARLAAVLAESVGWEKPARVTRALVIGDSRAARRLVAAHDAMFSQFAVRGRKAIAWLRHPSQPVPSGMLWFTRVPRARRAGITRSTRVRSVRTSG